MKSAINVLLIEDDYGDALILNRLICASQTAKIDITHSTRFQEGIAALNREQFDAILLDLGLPDGYGIDLVKSLRQRSPNIPIVVLTGNEDEALATAALKEGAQDYLLKSETLLPGRIKSLGRKEVGNQLVKTLLFAIERAELAQQLAAIQERYELAVEGAKDGIWDWNLKTNSIYYSSRWLSLIGLQPQDISERSEDWIERIHPDDREMFQQDLSAHLQQLRPQFQCEYRIRHADGSDRWMQARGRALWDENNQAYRIAGSQTDITARKALENAKELAQITLHSIGDAVITTDAKGNIQDFNPVAERLTGWRAKDAKRLPVHQVCNLIDSNSGNPLENPAMTAIKEGRVVTLSTHPTLISKSGEVFHIGDSAAPIRSAKGEILGTVMVFHDVTEERGRAKQLAWQAAHDPLTRLYNRQKFVNSVKEALEETRLKNVQHVLCCMDLDHFKVVNDTCGHDAGDKLLQQIAELWRSQVRASDALARLGGDEFGLLLYDCDLERAEKIAQDFCQSVQNYRFVHDNKVFRIGVSVGIVPITEKIVSIQEALKLGDSACYSAKNKGRNRVQVYYSSDNDIARQSADSQWFSRITEALESDLFCLYQQRIEPVEAKDGMPTFCELLLRLRQPHTDELMPPTAFIPPAERYSLMPKIDRWVINHFFQYLSSQNKEQNYTSSNHNGSLCNPNEIAQLAEAKTIIYTINLSGSSINDSEFVDFIQSKFEQYDIDPKQICFEITETVAISNLQKAAAFVLRVKQLGCRFALDDFGSGMSSFAYLKNLPVDYLKIDGHFVKEAPNDTVLCAMLEAINKVGHLMGLKTVAEYVENQAIWEKVRSLGIDYAQGFAVAMPQSIYAEKVRQPHKAIA